MRYFLFSVVIHLFVVMVGLFTLKDNLEFQRAGDPTVTFSMTGQAAYASGHTADIVTAQPKAAVKPKVKRKKTTKKKSIREEKKIPPEEAIENPLEKEMVVEPGKTREEVTEEVAEEFPTKSEDLDAEGEAKDTDLHETEEADKEISDTDTKPSSGSTAGQPEMGEGLVELDDGSIAARNQGVKGLSYGFIAQPEPEYPDIARKMGFNNEVIIKVRFLIGYEGRVEDIKFYDDMSNFGFRNEVEKALNHWRATPITVNGEKVKLYFYKSFKFEKL